LPSSTPPIGANQIGHDDKGADLWPAEALERAGSIVRPPNLVAGPFEDAGVQHEQQRLVVHDQYNRAAASRIGHMGMLDGWASTGATPAYRF
jgi:hypothetical protein